jgi:hypothetical protein
VLARSVDSGKRFFVKEQPEMMLGRYPVHQRHNQQVLIDGEVGLTENRRQLKLIGCHLVVPGLQRNAIFICFKLHLPHECCYPGRYRSKIVILQLLVLGTLVPHQCPAGEVKIGPGIIEGLVDKEVLLFPTQVGIDLFHFRVEEPANLYCSLVNSRQRFQQRGLVIESFTRIGDENRRDTKGIVYNEGGRRRIPGGVSPGLKGIPDTSAGETRRIRFLLCKQFT